jgi:hypothetical protein
MVEGVDGTSLEENERGEGGRGREQESYVEKLSQGGSTQDPRVPSGIGIPTVATVEDAWVSSGGVIHVDLRQVKEIVGRGGLSEMVTLYSLQKRVL